MKKKILVAMSGGLDSSVAAYLLVRRGYDIAGITMSLGLHYAGGRKRRPADSRDIDDAKRVCHKLGISHYVIDSSAVLRKKVIDDFVAQYVRGRTPNPCIQCNRYIKFGLLLRAAKTMGFDYLATGHYVMFGDYKGQTVLRRPKDLHKDQTYFLYSIPRSALRRIMFPLGDLIKDRVRHIAHEARLGVAQKPQSQDICFVPDKDYASFLAGLGYRGKPGDIVDEHGNVLGRHKGVIHYTVGQRGGLGLGARQPLYVKEIDATRNRLVVCARAGLAADGLIACRVNLHVSALPRRAMVKIRYGHAAVPARVTLRNSKLTVMFEKAQESVTPGQSAVIYDRDMLLGGGIIERVIRR